MVFKSIVKESYLKHFTKISNIALHIETTSLADGTYEFIKKLDEDFFEAQINTVELTEAPNSNLEEPQSTDLINTDTG